MKTQTSTNKPSPSSSLTPRVAVLAIDGLDWELLQHLVDSGQMPFCNQLLDAGCSATMTVPPPNSTAASWSTVATGVMADQHGVCHDLEVRPDNLTLQQTSSDSVLYPPFWQLAMDEGLVTYLAGWPSTFPAQLPANAAAGCRIVSAGFELAEHGEHGDVYCWPLSPEAVVPFSERSTVQDARVHPADLEANMVAPLLSKGCFDLGTSLTLVAGRQLAQLASVHNLGVHWAQQSDWQLLVLRFDVLPAWLKALKEHGIDSIEGLSPWYRYLDMMIGRYMAIIGRTAHLVLISDHGLPPKHSTAVEQLFGVRSSGCMITAGPSIPADQLLNPISGLDICPSLLALLGLTASEILLGRNVLATNNEQRNKMVPLEKLPADITVETLLAENLVDQKAQNWLTEQGFPAVNLTPLKSMVKRVRAETLAGWASAQHARGRINQAIISLEHALELAPEDLGLRLALGEHLLEAGRVVDCQALVEGLPPAAKEGLWPDVIASLIAVSEENWAVAEHHLGLLAVSDKSPINSYAWLARTKLAQQDWGAAERMFTAALTGLGEKAVLWDGLGYAQLQLGRSDQAIQSFSQAIANQPSNALYHQARALAYEHGGNLAKAQYDLWRALTLDASLLTARHHLVRLASLVNELN
jgi:tetratricopeptide (TPR) repeat protein